jgi:hypothetical protein
MIVEERAAAQARATDALRFYDTMRRYGKIMLVLTTLTFMTSLFSLARSIVHDARIERIELRLEHLESKP